MKASFVNLLNIRHINSIPAGVHLSGGEGRPPPPHIVPPNGNVAHKGSKERNTFLVPGGGTCQLPDQLYICVYGD